MTVPRPAENRPARTAAIVAFLGTAKPLALRDFLVTVQSVAAELFGTTFLARPMDRIHSTIIGLDSVGALTPGDELRQLQSTEAPDAFGLFHDIAARLESSPLTLQFGGFAPSNDYPVVSRGMRLYERSVSADAGQLLTIGWPVDIDGRPGLQLDQLRRGAQEHGFVHRYALTAGHADPDAHMVIGALAEDTQSRAVATALSKLRDLASRQQCRASLDPSRLSLVLYDDPRLPKRTTTSLPLVELVESAVDSGS